MPISIKDTLQAMEHDREMERRFHGNTPVDKCRKLAANALGVSYDSTYVVMFSFVLGHFKAFCSSSEMHDNHGHYIEVVYNDCTEEYYVIHYEETSRETHHAN